MGLGDDFSLSLQRRFLCEQLSATGFSWEKISLLMDIPLPELIKEREAWILDSRVFSTKPIKKDALNAWCIIYDSKNSRDRDVIEEAIGVFEDSHIVPKALWGSDLTPGLVDNALLKSGRSNALLVGRAFLQIFDVPPWSYGKTPLGGRWLCSGTLTGNGLLTLRSYLEGRDKRV